MVEHTCSTEENRGTETHLDYANIGNMHNAQHAHNLAVGL